MASPFNDYDDSGFRITRNGTRSSKIEDESILRNLKFRWPNELAKYSDTQILNEYDDFAMSDWFGDNDARFLEWMETYGEY